MNHSAPWSYQGMPPGGGGSDTGQVKMFNPAQLPNTSQADTALYNGQPETQAGGQGYFPQGEEQNGVAEQNYQYYQQSDGQMNYGYDQGQNYDQNQQFYNQQQYWDPNYGDQQWQGYYQQGNYEQYGGHDQQWGVNAGYSQDENSLNVNAEHFVPNNYHQQSYDASQGQGYIQQDHVGQGHQEDESLDQSYTSEGSTSFSQSNDTSGLGGFFHGDSLSNSCAESVHEEKVPDNQEPNVEGSIHTDVSGESLQTVNDSAGSISNVGQNVDVSELTSQLRDVSLHAEKDDSISSKNENVTQGVDQSTLNQHNSSQSEGGGVAETPSGGSQHSEGLSDWEVVQPQMLSVPGQQSREGSTHSREGSIDNSVQFFIGSSRNSDEGGTPESFMQLETPEVKCAPMEEVPKDDVPVNVYMDDLELGHQPANNGSLAGESSDVSHPQPPVSSDRTDITTNKLIPQHTSSPNMSPAQKPGVSAGPPPMPPKMGPPVSTGEGGGNPFRRDKGKTSNYTPPSKSVAGGSFQQNNTSDAKASNPGSTKLSLHIAPPDMGVPSPIMSSSDETVTVSHPNTPPAAPKGKTQSPIMPRKESPFQPPSRRRTLSGHSSESIEEQPKLEKQWSQEEGSKPLVSEAREKSASISSQSSKGSSKGEKPKSDEKSQSDRERELSKYQERVKKASKPPIGSSRGVMSPRRIESAFQQVQKQRAKHNMSPATSLWADNDLVLPASNILLAPAAPVLDTAGSSNTSSVKSSPAKTAKDTRDVLSPVQMLISSLSEKQSKESTPERDVGQRGSKTQNPPKSPEKKTAARETRRDISPARERHERGSSIDRELEISRKLEGRDARRDRDDYRHKDYYRDDRYRGRDSRGPRDPRDPRDRDPRDRDHRDMRDRDYDPYYDRSYRDKGYYGDERYDRPRSRHSLLDDERSSSRQDSERPRSRQDSESTRSRQDIDRPRSRQDYGRDYYRDRYGREKSEKNETKGKSEKVIEEVPESREGYEYDRYCGRGYYDRHGYYDNKHGYYDRHGYYRYEDYYSRGNNYDERYPSQYNDPYGPPYEDVYRHSQRSGSRVHTPGSLSDAGDNPDYGYGYGSRSSSRQGYDEYTKAQWDAYYANYRYGYQDPYYQEEARPGRMTPAKHSIPHLCVRFGPGGQLVKVLPNRPSEGEPATVEIHDVSEMLQDYPETDELKSFPGPLVRNDTHKSDVLVFCQRKAKECADNIQMMDRESAELVWRYLELLIKQNGTYVGTDVADLLLEGHEPTTMEYSMMGMKISPSLDNLDEELNETMDTNMSTVTADRSVINRGGRKSREETTDRFRHLLLYGRKKDALEWAMKNNLWGHALFLASKMDSRAHANVMTRFANSAMKMNDPLQTLYQLMSGRQPAAVTCIADEKWGDWRPHLAMVLSNHSSKPDLERKSIMTLGDTLASKGFLHASHLCYLMAQVNFGSYQKKTSKMVLIGSNHSLPLNEFASNEAIQCTEIYEYAMSLGNPNNFSVNFQYFKFLYTCRLMENGFAQEALQYLEVISRLVVQSPTLFQPSLVKLVYEFANRLKYFDPQRQHTGDDTEDPFWLQQLQRVNQGFMDGSIQPVSGSVTPYGAYGLRAASTESGEVAGYTTGTDNSVTQPYSGFPFSNEANHQTTQGFDQTQYNNSQYLTADQNQQNQGQITQTDTQASQEVNQGQHGQNQMDPTLYQQQWEEYYRQQAEQQQQWQYGQYQQTGQTDNNAHQGGEHVKSEGDAPQQENADNVHQKQSQQNQIYQPQGHSSQNYGHTHNASHAHFDPRRSMSSTVSGSVVTDDDEDEDDEEDEEGRDFDDGGAQSNFSYFDNFEHKPIVAPKLRKRTESEASNTSGDKHHHNTGDGSHHASPAHSSKQGGKENKKPVTKSQNLNQQQQGKGMFSGFINKIWGKASKNEMKLPDDTKKSIVWDAEKKRWKNMDATEEDDKPPPPPPKDTPSSTMPAPADAAAGPPAGNKFSLRRGAASRYVDVMNTKPAPTKAVPQSLFNVMPTSQSSPAIFSPGGPADTAQSDATETQQTSVAPPASQNDSTIAEESSQSKEAAANGMPVMFNPAQFQNNQSAGGFQSGPASTRSSGRLRPGQRRQYPK